MLGLEVTVMLNYFSFHVASHSTVAVYMHWSKGLIWAWNKTKAVGEKLCTDQKSQIWAWNKTKALREKSCTNQKGHIWAWNKTKASGEKLCPDQNGQIWASISWNYDFIKRYLKFYYV